MPQYLVGFEIVPVHCQGGMKSGRKFIVISSETKGKARSGYRARASVCLAAELEKEHITFCLNLDRSEMAVLVGPEGPNAVQLGVQGYVGCTGLASRLIGAGIDLPVYYYVHTETTIDNRKLYILKIGPAPRQSPKPRKSEAKKPRMKGLDALLPNE